MPSKSKRLQVLERVVDVLKTIQEGDDFWYSPRDVFMGYVREVKGYPAYSVRAAMGEQPTIHLDQQHEETFTVEIHGEVRAAGDIVTPREKCIQDVREAINDDFKPGGASTSLIGLASSMFIADLELEDGPEGDGFFGYFVQRVRFQIYGEYGEI